VDLDALIPLLALMALLGSCAPERQAPPAPGGDDDSGGADDDDSTAVGDDDTGSDDDDSSPCPPTAVEIEDFCIDRFEAPNVEGELPLVMFTFVEAANWCGDRGKRLCFDDEWMRACEGLGGSTYPYGDTHQPGVCNDDETWLAYNQDLLNGWPGSVCTPAVTELEGLLDAARQVSGTAATAADHVWSLYQGEPSGDNAGCTNADGAHDLCGNVEEWTRRRDGGSPDFHGSLKGRYWAESRTCQQAVTTHGDNFRFYEIGFRCCSDPLR
jgi:formylglycine-generating enzyme required for sulfatase activity